MVSLLPPTNLLLLRHLVCVLHHTSLHSDRNQMTSGNLAICLGPTFLWPEGTVDLTSQFGSVELVARVTQMLIDDAQSILGSDSLEMFRDVDDDRDTTAGAELNFESEDSFGSHELIDNKRMMAILHRKIISNYYYYFLGLLLSLLLLLFLFCYYYCYFLP